MEILAHRGWWRAAAEKNTSAAFERAFRANYGVETDVRDCNGEILISHDMPKSPGVSRDMPMRLEAFLDLYALFPVTPTLAINVKADGLCERLFEIFSARRITRYFVFDMSIPDTLSYLAMNVPVFTRRSEYECGSYLDTRASGLWLDCFEKPYVPASAIRGALTASRRIAIVSPELHRKPHADAWMEWRTAFLDFSEEDRNRILLCTDFPELAQTFFESKLDVNNQSSVF